MDGLILAAGFGSRLRDLFPSKPLARVNGVTLLEIAVRQLASAGVSRVVVVTGYEGDRIEKAARELSARVDLEIVTTRVEDWEKPNGYSVVAGARLISGNYLLVMCDHILSSPLLQGLTDTGGYAGGGACDVTLAIDRQTVSPLIDPDDATWVRTGDNGLIQHIGKELTTFNAIDCGAFFAGPGLAEAIEEAIAKGKQGSLSDGMQMLADRSRAGTYDVGGAWWMDVDDPKAHAMAQDLLDTDFSLLGNSGAHWVALAELGES